MGLMVRKDFSRGWVPSADSVNCPENGLLRMDNCVLDELGVVSLRLGSTRAVAVADTDIHSLYTAVLGGTKYRMIGAGNTLAANTTVLAASGAGTSGDMAFTSWLGQIFAARNTYKKKWNGTTLNNWGITAPAAPTATPVGGEFATLSTCEVAGGASPEVPAFTASEGAVAPIAGYTGAAALTAAELTSSATTFRGTMTRLRPAITAASNAAPIVITAASHGLSNGDKVTVSGVLGNTAANGRWTVANVTANTFELQGSTGNGAYTSGGHFGLNMSTLSGGSTITDLDVIEMFVYLTDPSLFKRLTLMVDFNDGTFGQDWAQYTWEYQETAVETTTDVIPFTPSEQIERIYQDSSGYALDNVDLSRISTQTFERTSPVAATQFKPTLANWNYINAPRGSFVRSGGSLYTKADGTKDSFGWHSVKAVRVTFEATASTILRFDEIRTVQGLHGNYVYRTVYVNETGTYNELSPPSAASSEVANDNSASLVTWVASGDAQVTHVYVYRMGGTLDRFYRVGRVAVGALTLTDTLTDASAIITNITLQADDAGPPDEIIGIESDYYSRLFCLTQNYVYPSRLLQPGNFSAGQAIRVGDGTQPAYWIKKAFGGIYVGGARDIYRLEGDGTEQPDGSLNFQITPLNIAYPPVDASLAVEGNFLVYRASDGPRLLTGSESTSLRGDTDLLWRGYTRHGVSPPNATSSSARFRMAISHGMLHIIVPEGSSTTTSTAIWKYNFRLERWYRHTYPTAWKAIAREPDGTIIAGETTAGYVYTIDTGTQDNATNISPVIWTGIDDNGSALNRKRPERHYMRLDTGGAAASVALHLEGSSSMSQTLSLSSLGESRQDTGTPSLTIGPFVQIQHRITGSFSTFRLYEFGLQYVDLPTLFFGKTAEILVAEGDEGVLSGIRVTACTLGVERSFGVYLDDTLVGTYTLTTETDSFDPTIFQFTESLTATEAYLTVNGNIEMYDWKPLVLYKNPTYRKVWDIGFPQLAADDFAWVRGLRFKVKASSELTAAIYIDGALFDSQTIQPFNTPTQYEVGFARNCKGHQPRVILSATEAFQPYWLDLFIRDTGHVTQKKVKRVFAP